MYVNDVLTRSVRRFGSRRALTDGTTELTYAELGALVSGYAERLRGFGLGRGSVIALRLDRSVDMVTLFLATQWLGATYLPIDGRLPPARVRFMLEDAGCDRLILADDAPDTPRYENLGCPALRLSRLRPESGGPAAEPGGGNPSAPDTPEPGETAYVLYTSGSTGLPKGVPVSSDNLAFFTDWLARTYTARETRCSALTISVGFDVSFAEILAPLVHGGTLALFEDVFQIEGTDLPLTALVNTPGNLSRYLERSTLPETLEVVTSAGEPLSVDLARRLMDAGVRLINGYGPTEATVYTTYHEVTRSDLDAGSIPIGRPLSGVQAVVRHTDASPCADGEPGELEISGPNVSSGYRSAHAGDSGAFSHGEGDPYPTYRTGDIVVRDTSGVLRYLGRRDRQYKVNGIRVDLQEISTHLLAREGVANGHVCVRETPEGSRITAFVIPVEGVSLNPVGIQRELAELLPRYCVPHDLLVVPELPTTLSGKIDESTLLERALRSATDGGDDETGGREEPDRIAELLAHCSSVATTGTSHENGPSLHALSSIELIRLRQTLLSEHGVDVPLRLIYECTDTAEFAALLRRRSHRAGSTAGTSETLESTGCDVAEENIWLADAFAPGTNAHNELYRLTFTRAVTAEQVEKAIRECVRDFPALRTSYRRVKGRLVREVADVHGVDVRVEKADPDDARLGGPDFAGRPFDLADPLKIRVRYVPGEPPVVWMSIHHIAIDAEAVDTLLGHFEDLLLGRPTGRFSEKRAVRHGAPKRSDLLRFWEDRLSLLSPLDSGGTVVPFDPARPSERLRSWVSDTRYQDLLSAVHAARTSVFGLAHAALTTVLGHTLGVKAVSLGTPVTKRSGRERRVACLSNMVPLIAVPEAGGDPRAHLARLRRETLEALEHSDISLSELKSAQARSGTGDAPLMHAVLAEVRAPGKGASLFHAEEVFTGAAKSPLAFLFEDTGEALELVAEHTPHPGSAERVGELLEAWATEIGSLSAIVAGLGEHLQGRTVKDRESDDTESEHLNVR